MESIFRQLNQLHAFLHKQLPIIIGQESVNFFKKSFYDEGFTDISLQKWIPTKRKDPTSNWYGFQYGARTPLPFNHPRRKGSKRKYKARKINAITNYSPAATKRKTLTGMTGDLKESIQFQILSPQKVLIFSDLSYAKIHNEGGTFQIFGKTKAIMPKRPFIGKSRVLEKKIIQIVEHQIKKILL